jgi:hypothetical protein
MNEILKVFNQYKFLKFKKIQQQVEDDLSQSYENERETWSALYGWEIVEWEEKGGYGAWWYDYIDSPYDGIYEYINELMDKYWNYDEVLNTTLDANAGLDLKTIYDELIDLVFSTMDRLSGISHKIPTTTNFINWNENPFEV